MMSEEEKEAIEELKEEVNKPLEVPEDRFDTFILFNTESAKTVLNYIDKLQKENKELKEKEKNLLLQLKDSEKELLEISQKLQELKDNQLWSEATIEGLKESFIPKEKVNCKKKEYEEMLKTLNKKSDTDRIKAINERIIGYKELL